MSDIERNEMLLTVVLNELPHLKALPDKPEPPVLLLAAAFHRNKGAISRQIVSSHALLCVPS